MSDRPYCKVCGKNPRAAAYYRNNKRYYRSRCERCIKNNKLLPTPKPRWSTKGYTKKKICDICGFKSKYQSQIVVYHIDGNLNNCELINLRSICLNCVEVVTRRNTLWRRGDLVAD
jgi:hypothetical protein